MRLVQDILTQFDLGTIRVLVIKVAAVLLCIVVHEVSHGYAAYRLGDPTAKAQNRLSMNPIRHIDPIGALLLLTVGFGWAKPVPVNMWYFKNPKQGMAITALAGPLSNFILAFILAFFFNGLFGFYAFGYGGAAVDFLVEFLYYGVVINIGLGLFNLIPFPPLDGSKILAVFLPSELHMKLMRYERYGFLVLLALVWLGFLDTPLYTARMAVTNFILGSSSFLQEIVISMLR